MIVKARSPFSDDVCRYSERVELRNGRYTQARQFGECRGKSRASTKDRKHKPAVDVRRGHRILNHTHSGRIDAYALNDAVNKRQHAGVLTAREGVDDGGRQQSMSSTGV